MSVCISNSGEYSAHKLDSDFICNRCFAFGEEEAVTEIETLTEQHKFEMMRAKSAESEVARLSAAMESAIKAEDSMTDRAHYVIVGEMVAILERGLTLTVEAEEE